MERLQHDEIELDEGDECPRCHGQAMPIGQLADTLHLRCRCCGAQWSRSARPAPSQARAA